jgi:predicted enzyme related to lactoylglutathione lyase
MPRVVQFYTKVFKIVQPKMAIPGIGYYAVCKDSEGNTFGIMQDDPTAK